MTDRQVWVMVELKRLENQLKKLKKEGAK